MEYFEITFIIKNYNHNSKSVSAIKGIIESSRLCSNSNSLTVNYSGIWFDLIEDEEIDKLYVSFPDIKFSRNNLKELLGKITEMVSDCFEHVPEIQFATGIFEMSFYYFEDKHSTSRLEDFTDEILSHFPIVFYRTTSNINDEVFIKSANAICVFHQGEDVQDIF